MTTRTLTPDVCVIGGGMAGSVAAMTAAATGADTVLVRSSGGATAVSSGAIDILGYLPGSDDVVPDPLAALGDKRLGSEHPYRVLGEAAPEAFRLALGFVAERLRAEDLEYAGEAGKNVLLPTPLGTWKPTALAPATVITGNLLAPDKAKVLVVGYTGYGGLNAEYVAQSLGYLGQACLGALGGRLGGAAAVRVDLPGLEGRANLGPRTVARTLDAPEATRKLANALATEVRRSGATFVFFPILGDKRVGENRDFLRRELGCEVAEMLTVPPSWRGHVLDRALEAACARAGVRTLPAHKASGSLAKGQAVEVVVRPVLAGAGVTLRPKAVVLATGDVVGGGLEPARRVITESVFGVPVSDSQGASAGAYLSWSELDLFPRDGHPVTALGLATDAAGRVLADGKPVGNLFAAGAVLRGSRRHGQKCGLGLGVVTGWVAGRSAAECA